MPDDLLVFVGGPPGYDPRWLWLGLILLILVIAWYVTVFVATMPAARLRRMPVVRSVHSRVLRYRFARTVATITRRHRSGELSGEQTSAALSRTLRSFLQATGTRAQYMQLRAVAASDLAVAAPLLSALGDARFD
ncbi:MAG TPA: hypothetical protein VIQ11_04885, partial [Mycobacterium sp.]